MEALPGSAGDAAAAMALSRLLRKLSTAGSEDEIRTIVSHGVRTLLHADGATFVMRDGDHCFYAEEDAVSPLWKGRRFPLTACISGWCMLHRSAASIPDIYKDRRIPADAYRPTFVRSLAMVPVGAEEPVAALGAYWAAQRQPRPAELLRLQTIADAAALALASVQRQGPPPIGEETRRRGPVAAVRSAADALFNSLRRIGLRPNTLSAFAFAIACVGAATLLREAIRATGVHGLAVFATFYPAVLISALFGGVAAGALAAVLGGFASYYFFLSPQEAFQGLTVSDVLNLSLYGGASALIVLIIDWHQRAIARLRREDALHLTLAREQRHRTRNASTVVEAIVRQSLRDLPDRAVTINHRVRAGLTNVVPFEEASEPFQLRQLLMAELAPYDLARFDLIGGEESLPPGRRNIVALAAHELAVNALKYGALSVAGGRVEVSWEIEPGRAVIRWREEGGPEVEVPGRRGYGSTLLGRLIQGSGGALSIDYPPSGVSAELAFDLIAARRIA